MSYTANNLRNTTESTAYGVALLRIALGIIYIAHSAYLKVFVFTIPGTVGFFESLGLPAIAAYGTLAVETLGGLALVFGYHSRVAAALLVPVALGATWAHFGAGWLFTNQGGGWEYPLFLAVASTAIALTGDGALSISNRLRRKAVTPAEGAIA